MKQLETGISRKYGEKADWMKNEMTKQTKDDAELIMNQEYSQTKEVPQRNELIYEENFPLWIYQSHTLYIAHTAY